MVYFIPISISVLTLIFFISIPKSVSSKVLIPETQYIYNHIYNSNLGNFSVTIYPSNNPLPIECSSYRSNQIIRYLPDNIFCFCRVSNSKKFNSKICSTTVWHRPLASLELVPEFQIPFEGISFLSQERDTGFQISIDPEKELWLVFPLDEALFHYYEPFEPQVPQPQSYHDFDPSGHPVPQFANNVNANPVGADVIPLNLSLGINLSVDATHLTFPVTIDIAGPSNLNVTVAGNDMPLGVHLVTPNQINANMSLSAGKEVSMQITLERATIQGPEWYIIIFFGVLIFILFILVGTLFYKLKMIHTASPIYTSIQD